MINFKWRNNYFSISRCNTAIKAILAAGSLSEESKASYVAEMKTLRAYYYFDMYRLFEKFPYFDETVSNPSQCRADEYTRAQIIDFIKTDLRNAYKALPESQQEVGRFNRYVAASILARVALFNSDWAEAEEYAGYVIASGKYDLYPNFLDMSKPEYNNMYESVMAVQFSSANSPDQFNFNNCLNCTWSDGNLYGNGDDFYLASQDLVNAFRTDANGLPYLDGTQNSESVLAADYAGNVDPRLDFTLGRIGMPWRSHQYNEKWCRNLELYGQYSGKKPYPAPESPYVKPGIVPWGASSLNYIIIRYADVLLNYAEALAELNGAANANEIISALHPLRDRVGMPDVDFDREYNTDPEYPFAGLDKYVQAVRRERRVEKACEGRRLEDILRWAAADELIIGKWHKGALLSAAISKTLSRLSCLTSLKETPFI